MRVVVRAVERAAATEAATAVATGAEEPPLAEMTRRFGRFDGRDRASAVPMAIPVVPAASVVTAARWRRVETASRRVGRAQALCGTGPAVEAGKATQDGDDCGEQQPQLPEATLPPLLVLHAS